MKKYELTENKKEVFGIVLFQIKALVNIDRFNVKKGDLGGWIEKEKNLSQDGDAWVYGDALVSGNAWVSGNARVCGDALVCGNAWVSGNARVSVLFLSLIGKLNSGRKKKQNLKKNVQRKGKK